MKTKLKYLLWSSILLCSSAFADHYTWKDRLSYSGYASQYYLQSNGASYFDGDGGTFSFREAGINAAYDFSKYLTAYGHVGVLRDKLIFDYAFLSISNGDLDTEYGINIGKVKRDLSLANNTRRNSTARRTIILPPSTYFGSADDLTMSVLGVSTYVKQRLGDFTIRGEFATGKHHITDDESIYNRVVLLQTDGPYDLDITKLISTIGITAEYKNMLKFHFATTLSPVEFKFDEHPAPFQENITDQGIMYYGVEYRNNKLFLRAEGTYAKRKVKYTNPLFPGRYRNSKYYGQYIMASYDLTPKWQLVTYYDWYDTKIKFDPAIVPDVSTEGSDIMVGVKYNITDKLSVRGEYHKLDGSLPLLDQINDNDLSPGLKDKWDVFVIGINYRF